jgi:hypothetical protein
VILTLLWLAACHAPGDDSAACAETCACTPPAVTIGTGPLPFAPMTEGQDVVMVHGPQGGWHVLAGLRASGVQRIVRIHYTLDALVAEPPVRVSDTRSRVMLVTDGACGGDYPDLFGYLDVRALADGERDTPPELLDGALLRMTLGVEDETGRSAEASLDVRAVPDPVDVGAR